MTIESSRIRDYKCRKCGRIYPLVDFPLVKASAPHGPNKDCVARVKDWELVQDARNL